MKRFFITLIASILFLGTNAQELRMPRFFADNMVMQRGEKIPVWGWGAPGKTVKVNMNGKTVFAKVAANGEWKAFLPKMNAGGPYNMSVDYVVHGQADKIATLEVTPTVITVQNILIGDVFLCSGQSNMELPIRRCMDVVRDDVAGYKNSNIRYLKFPHQYNYVKPNSDVRTLGWQDITADNSAEVSGICYFMARHLQEYEEVPIGIINSAVGGTQVQAWMPHKTLKAFPGYASELSKQKYHQQNWPDSIMRLENKAAMDWERRMIQSDTIVTRWRTADYDFTSWKPVNIFSDWSKGKNGSYWFHKTFEVAEQYAGKKAIIRLGAMKDADSVFVNGTFVGNTTYEYPPRIYNIPEGVLRQGKNEVVVHLMSQSGRGNFTSGKLYQVEVGNAIIPLAGSKPNEVASAANGEAGWTMAVGSHMNRKPSSTYFVDTPTGLYNAMIAPLRDFPIKAMLWYQGESNVGNTSTYAPMLEAMVGSWRKQFGRQFPVAIVQLAGYMARHDKPFESGWTQIRNQQYIAAQKIKNASLVSIFDTGEWNDIHPQDKRTAGNRAALVMRKIAYGEKELIAEGPQPVSARKVGEDIVVTFSPSTGKIILKADNLKGNSFDEKALRQLTKDFHSMAEITGEYELTIHPTGLNTAIFNIKDGKLRYAWDDYPVCVIYNEQGIPSPQFEIKVSTKQ